MGEPELSLERPSPWVRARLALPDLQAEGWTWPDAASIRAALVPLAPVFVAILVPPLRPAALAFVLVGFLVQRWRGSGDAWPWAATLPVATIITWTLVPAPAVPVAAASCADPLSPTALWRAAELTLVIVMVAVLGRSLGAGRRHLPLGLPDGWILTLAAAFAFLVAPVALLVHEDAARPFFGTLDVQIGLAGAVVPALIFAVSNGVLEETVYRGVLLGWMERHLGTVGAIVVQAAAFGLAHTGSDFIGSPAPVIASIFVLGILGGVVVKKTGSLFVPIVVHAAIDIPLYYGLACRLS